MRKKRLRPAAVLVAKLAAELVEVLEDRVLPLAVHRGSILDVITMLTG